MHTYNKIYEFAASAGALEGYVYKKEKIDPNEINNWVNNLVSAYKNLPKEAIDEFHSSLDGTLGRAIRSLIAVLGEDFLLTFGKRNDSAVPDRDITPLEYLLMFDLM